MTAAIGKIAHAAAKNAVPGVGLTFGRPEASNASRRVNLYLYQVLPNAARRNDELPSRGAGGNLAGRPRAALDLHYLFTFHGKADSFEPERMAGAVTRELHTNPVLDSGRLTDGAAGEPALQESDLAAAVDRVRITPMLLSLEEVSRLWSVLVQTPHVLSVAYEASVVLIDATASAPAPLPVLRRGSDGRGAIVGTDRVPRLGAAWIGFTDAPATVTPLASLPTAALGTSVIVEGNDLEADSLDLVFKHPLRPPVTLSIPSASRTETELKFDIPDDGPASTTWAAGLYSVTAKLQRDGKEVVSPIWPFLLAPRLGGLNVNPPGPAGASIDVTATLRPQVGANQKAILRAGAAEQAALPRVADTDPVVFRLDPAPALAGVLARIEVDGVESMPVMIDPVAHDFVFDPAQRLTIT
ncbi:MAG TPA: DUF4255 domain-containing protein [Sphingomicrobium sp.]